MATHFGHTTGGAREARQNRNHGGFARTVGAEQGEKLTMFNRQRDIVERLEARARRTLE